MDALVVAPEWTVFRSPGFALVRDRLENAALLDGRNICNARRLAERSFTYYGFGCGVERPPSGSATV